MIFPPEISVVMANYNGRRYLRAAIWSLQKQIFKSWELIFADDCSTDGSVALAEELARDDPRIRIFRQPENRGPAAARNLALDAARGRWIAIFDGDDIMRPVRLDALHRRALCDSATIVADNLLVFSGTMDKPRPFLTRNCKTPRWIGLAEYIDSNRLYSRTPDLGYLKPFIDGAMLRKRGLRYDERLRIGEDYDFMARLLAAGERLRLEPRALYLYRKHPASISHRIGAEQIQALIEADARFVRNVPDLKRDEVLALQRRMRSLKTMLLYDRVIGMLKAHRYGAAFSASIAAPYMWPLLTQPVRARLARLAAPKRDDARQPAVAELQ